MLRVLDDEPADEEEFRAHNARMRRDRLRAARTVASACARNDVEAFYRSVDGLSMVEDGWGPAMRAIARLDAVGANIPTAFMPIWIETKMMPLRVGDRRILANALRLLMPRNYAGGDLQLWRGASFDERRRKAYGFSWTTKLAVAQGFAEHWAKSRHGGVILETVAPAGAILVIREDEDYYDEGEVVADPFALRRVTVAARLPPTEMNFIAQSGKRLSVRLRERR